MIAAYVTALVASVLLLKAHPTAHPVSDMLVADIAATLIVFIFSLSFRNSSIYDPYWSVYPIFIAWWWTFTYRGEGDIYRNIAVLVLVTIWGIRLTWNWARGWQGLAHEDWRYRKLSEDTGRMYWLVSLSGVHLFPTLLVFLGCVPLYYIFRSEAPFGLTDLVAVFITSAAVLIETIADIQLHNFRKLPPGKRPKILRRGLWSWSRHPNYFGEISFWVGLFLFCIPVYSPGNYWLISGALAMIALFVFISIPMMEEREKRKEGYDKYQKEVSMLVPLPKRKR